jgi:hypothetical protein
MRQRDIGFFFVLFLEGFVAVVESKKQWGNY